MWTSTRSVAEALDHTDALADLRVRYDLPPGLIRLDGDSGGPLRTTPARLRRFVMHRHGTHTGRPRGESEWRREARLAAIALAPLIGAAPKELTVGESTSINLFKALLAAARLRPGRPVLAVGRDCFTADRFLAKSAAEFIGGRLHLFNDISELAALPCDEVAVVALSHTDLRTGAVRDASAITAEIHRRGALALWDLSHSAGALHVDLHGWRADFAIGCGHKYLGGGAGAPAYSFVADRHRGTFPVCTTAGVLHPLADGFTGSASTLSVSELRTGLSILAGIDVAELAAKTASLVQLFVDRLDHYCADTGIEVVRPPGPTGAQILLRHERAQHIADALFDRDIVVEHPAPDLLRLNFAPSWLRYVDVWEAAEQLHAALHDVN
ncbi:aminotransferase class V-fold PLP-dependent enzyme [Saccharopolyspora hirsuta]|uniref:Aminotransferase class V-fold PLP-dependent enzyme n=1 Tax=Saccharopolyspora hirsuta TaxID=1837 RepID=A0A5M7C0L6_SACHI|nr:aminotransferase class V-fold PLP-dependent enzyme [Saccharopolyspora hirsuta]KAA5835986.1 aminotransferase class V-fold PLP-dependent enzyme [Saccharopolyspora hirsuta]